MKLSLVGKAFSLPEMNTSVNERNPHISFPFNHKQKFAVNTWIVIFGVWLVGPYQYTECLSVETYCVFLDHVFFGLSLPVSHATQRDMWLLHDGVLAYLCTAVKHVMHACYHGQWIEHSEPKSTGFLLVGLHKSIGVKDICKLSRRSHCKNREDATVLHLTLWTIKRYLSNIFLEHIPRTYWTSSLSLLVISTVLFQFKISLSHFFFHCWKNLGALSWKRLQVSL